MAPSHEQIALEAARYQELEDRQEYWMHRLGGLTQEQAHRETLRKWNERYTATKRQCSYDEDKTADRHEPYSEDPDALDSTVQFGIMEDLVSRLPPEDLLILNLHKAGKIQQEIALSLKVSQAAISYRLSNIHTKLREAYRIEQNRITPEDLEGYGLTPRQLECCRALLRNGRLAGYNQGYQNVVNAAKRLPPRAAQYLLDLLSRGYATAWARVGNHQPYTNGKRGSSKQ